MKIVCDNCATKYSIADEKVRGKVFKIRCKKCSHIIVVRGNENGAEANGAAAGGNGAGNDAFAEESLSGAAAASPAATSGGSADSVWHLVIDREQVGPMTPAEVRTKFAAGEIDVETYAWREGFGDWLRLGSIEDFKDLDAKPAAAAPSDEGATRRTDAADLFARAAADDAESNQDAGADLFGAAGASPAAAPAAAAKPAAADVFAPATSNAFSGGGDAAPARSAKASTPKLNPAGSDLDGGGGGGAAGATSEQRMAGQRNENSVLFSLNNLQALASGSGAKGGGGGGGGATAKPGVDTRPGYANSQSEGSGLIDIRAMAASTLASSPAPSSSSSTKEEAPTFAAPPIFSPMAAPIMMPAAPTGTPKWVFAVLGVGVLAVVGIIVVGVLLLTRKPEAPPVVAVAPTTPPTTPQVAAPTTPVPGTPPAATAPTAPPTAVPGGETKTEAKVAEPAAEKKGSSSKRDKKDKGAKAEAASGAVVPPPTEAPKATPAPSGGKKRDAIDDLLDGASPDKGKKAAAVEKSSGGGGEDLPDQLDKGAIVGGMSKVKGKVAGCYDQFKVPGMANVSVTIAKSGTVSSASVSGAFAGTPTGSCVERAVKSATFPKFKGSPQSINYPFILR